MRNSAPFLNTLFFGPISTITDSISDPKITDRAWEAVGLSREVIEGPPLFVPYAIQCAFAEYIAHEIGEEHTGGLIGRNLRYTDLKIYGEYVLGAPDLATALRRGVRALPYIAGNVQARLDVGHGYVRLSYDAGLRGTKGAHHISEGVIFHLIDLSRHFLGRGWYPLWVELDLPETVDVVPLEDLYSAPVVLGAELPAIIIPAGDLLVKKPNGSTAREALVCGDLRELARFCAPQTTADMCADVLRLQLRAGDVTEEAIASRLSVGRRTLQRRLSAEGTSFREISKRVLEQRARQLLNETDHSIEEIGNALGYREINSFRRAFETWTGMSPSLYRAHIRRSEMP